MRGLGVVLLIAISAIFVAATGSGVSREEAAAVHRLNTLNAELRAMMAQFSDSLAETDGDSEADTDSDADVQPDSDAAGDELDDTALLQISSEDGDQDNEQLEEEGQETDDAETETEDESSETVDHDNEYQGVFMTLGEALVVARNRSRNVDPVAINRRHRGVTMGFIDPARLGLGREQISIIKETPVYDSLGEIELAMADPQPIGGQHDSGINAGTLATIKGEECVMAIRLRSDQGRVTGWVPVTAFSHAPEIVAYTKTVRRALDRVRPNDSTRKARLFHIQKKSALGKYKNRYVFPHQFGRDHLTKAYFTNRRTGTVNLLLNVPTEGGSTKWGEVVDVIPLDADFYRVRRVPAIRIPLFARGAAEPVAGVTLKFVYGYTMNKAQEKSWGWINREVLGD